MNFYPARLDGRSGRGDTCIGTYMARRLSVAPREAGIWAAAVTSLKMENPGPFNRSIGEVEDLIRSKYNHGSIR
jgi:sugar/nucleoside kinase (ribokinase family)